MVQTLETGQETRHNLESRIENTVRGILAEFERSGIPAMIMRNVHYIPSLIIDRGDIDIAVPGGLSEDQLVTLFADYGLIHWVWKTKNLHAYFKISNSYILRVDFHHRVNTWLGAEYMEESAVFSDTEFENGFRVASANTQAMMKWIPGLLVKGIYKDRYGDEISNAVAQDPERFRSLFRNALGRKMGDRFWDWAINRTPEKSADYIRETRDAVWWTAFFRNPFRTTSGLVEHFWNEILLRLKLRPAGISIVLIGPDGCGKTTLTSRLVDAPYQELPFAGKDLRRFFYPGLTSLMRKGRGQAFGNREEPPRGPHGKKPHSLSVGVVRLSYTVLRYWISEFSWVRYRIAKNALIVYDRHLLDLGVDPLRFRFGGPTWIARLFGKLAPQPDLVILLDAPAEIVHPRKKEVPFAETERQRRAYLDLVSDMENAYVIDASRSVEDLLDEVNHIINDFMTARTQQRIQNRDVRIAQMPEKALV